MRPTQVRAVRAGLLALLLLIVIAVAASIRRPPAPAAARPQDVAAPEEPSRPGGVARMDELVFRKLDEAGREKLVLRAESMLGQEQQDLRLKGVTLTFPYVARGEPGSASITADGCLYTAATQKAVFAGNVKVRSSDGLELTTDSLIYRGDKGVARTDAPVSFARKRLSGSSTGAVYQAEPDGRLELTADAFVRLTSASGPPLEIRSDTAVADREQGLLRFVGSVRAEQGSDVLRSGQLALAFASEDEGLAGFSASEDVTLRMGADSALPGLEAAAQAKGPQLLSAERLDVSFRPDRSAESATAGPDARLTLLPGPGEAREQRRLEARFLTFRFDEQGKLVLVEGQRDALLVIEPLRASSPPAPSGKVRPKPGPARPAARAALPPRVREARCRSFSARLDPATGALLTVDLRNDVEFAQATQRAKGDSGWYEAAKGSLTLERDPELQDLEDGSRLSALGIVIGTQSGDVKAAGAVRHVLGRGAARRPGFMAGGETPALVTSAHFSYESITRTTRYQEGAVLRSGRDEVRAPLIRMIQEKSGERRLAALDGVVSVVHPEPEPGQKEPAAVTTQAQQMIYEEAERRLVYTGDVVIRQGDLTSKSPAATVTLGESGTRIERIVAGDPVEILQGARRATGTQATYTPGDETIVIVGEKVTLKDPAQEVVGRSLTFKVGDERILVEGREEVRTETILQQASPRP